MSQGLPNQGIMQEKVQKGDFPKKPSWELKKKIGSYIPENTWKGKLEAASFLPSKYRDIQCDMVTC